MTKEIKSPIKQYNDTLSEDQMSAKKVMDKKVITCLTGRAGSGKTHLGAIFALEKLAMERKQGGVKGIVITRPIVVPKRLEMGFLPGDLWEKIDPWIKPIREIVCEIEGKQKYDEMVKGGILDIAPLMSISGITFTRKIILVDEAQNLTGDDTKDLFTRIGKGSRMIFIGDMSQCKLDDPRTSGFPRLCEMTKKSNKVGIYNLTTNFRDEIVEELLGLY